jgi:hypothetical protein
LLLPSAALPRANLPLLVTLYNSIDFPDSIAWATRLSLSSSITPIPFNYGSLTPLDIHSGSAESLRSDVGFRLFYQWQIGKVVVEPILKAAWEHEYKYSALPITACTGRHIGDPAVVSYCTSFNGLLGSVAF